MIRTYWTLTERCCLAFLVAGGVTYAATVSRADRQFMDTAARINMTQAHQGEIAENQANRADVKDLGKTLVQDYRQSYGELAQVAAKTNVSIPRGIDAAKDRTTVQLVSLKGVQFDRQFARDEVTALQRSIALFRHEAEHGEDAALKAYAAGMVPILQKDLKQAEACSKSVGRT